MYLQCDNSHLLKGFNGGFEEVRIADASLFKPEENRLT